MELKDIIHLYMGCEVYDHFNDVNVTLTPKAYMGYMEHWEKPEDGQIKPILRPLESMTEEEFNEFEKLTMLHNVTKEEMADEILENSTPQIFLYAISKSFDLFNLIPQNLAIDKSKLP